MIVSFELALKIKTADEPDKYLMSLYALICTERLIRDERKLLELQEVIKPYMDKLEMSGAKFKKMIFEAIGLSAGHWYQCPNGHSYVIGECGGAMEQSRCPECRSQIGGGSHELA